MVFNTLVHKNYTGQIDIWVRRDEEYKIVECEWNDEGAVLAKWSQGTPGIGYYADDSVNCF